MLAKATVPAAHLHTLVAPLLFLKSANCHSHPINAQTLVGFFLPRIFTDFCQKIKDEKRYVEACQTRPNPANLRLFRCQKIRWSGLWEYYEREPRISAEIEEIKP